MSKVCEICGKGYLKGNQVPRGIGRRVTRRTTIRQMPNLRTKRIEIDGTSFTLRICASCLKRLRKAEEVSVKEVGNTGKKDTKKKEIKAKSSVVPAKTAN